MVKIQFNFENKESFFGVCERTLQTLENSHPFKNEMLVFTELNAHFYVNRLKKPNFFLSQSK